MSEKKTLHLESQVERTDAPRLSEPDRLKAALKPLQYQKVLDHGYVKFVGAMGFDQSVVEAARMSTQRSFVSWEPYWRCKTCGCVWLVHAEHLQLMPGEKAGPCCDNHPKPEYEKFPKGDVGTLEYLWAHKHATPFEMCELVVEVKAPIMVFREWHRHRTQSYNEMSARYTQMPNEHYLPELQRIQKQSAHNKQGSAEAFDEDFAMEVFGELKNQQEEVYLSYNEWVDAGMAKEVARLNTPVSRYSVMRAKANLRNWLGFLNLRMRPGAQWEIRQYANAVASVVKALWPRTWALFEEYDLYAASFSRSELAVLKRLVEESPVGMRDTAQSLGLSGRQMEEFVRKVLEGGKVIL